VLKAPGFISALEGKNIFYQPLCFQFQLAPLRQGGESVISLIDGGMFYGGGQTKVVDFAKCNLKWVRLASFTVSLDCANIVSYLRENSPRII